MRAKLRVETRAGFAAAAPSSGAAAENPLSPLLSRADSSSSSASQPLSPNPPPPKPPPARAYSRPYAKSPRRTPPRLPAEPPPRAGLRPRHPPPLPPQPPPQPLHFATATRTADAPPNDAPSPPLLPMRGVERSLQPLRHRTRAIDMPPPPRGRAAGVSLIRRPAREFQWGAARPAPRDLPETEAEGAGAEAGSAGYSVDAVVGSAGYRGDAEAGSAGYRGDAEVPSRRYHSEDEDSDDIPKV
ncbi:hypothetical protein T492DRAFT_832152 [Pavlovales sp. CCMP2436]|nr:hypothetical protein T492DRAFT_832152 [Pavlovales sp. CCMP2436]